VKNLSRASIETFFLGLIYLVGLRLLATISIMDLLLAPGGATSVVTLGIAALFLLFRLFILLCLPGFFLARWYWLSYPAACEKLTTSSSSLKDTSDGNLS